VKTRIGFGILLLLTLLAGTQIPVRAQATGNRYFDETGHNVKGEFLAYYNSVKEAQMLFGFPITEEITSRDGAHVQYFQRVRMELHSELPAGQRIRLTDVGRKTYRHGRPLDIANPFACRSFPVTGYYVCYAFQDFFEQYGDVAVFGNPISNFEDHDGLIVQYFENARFEWKPWLPEGQKVGLAFLGRIYFDQLREDPNKLLPVPPEQSGRLLDLKVHPFVWKAVTLASDSQLIYIIVQDQNLFAVSNVQGLAVVRWASGSTETIRFTTNTSGVGIVPLSFTNQPYGTLVKIDILVEKDGVSKTTTTSFRIWY
jgi:hypothetical protein